MQYTKSWVNKKWVYRYIKDEKQYETVKKHYDILSGDDTSYNDYKKSFAYIANFFGLPKEEIIIEWLELQKSKNPNEPDRVALRYSKGLHKVKIPKDIQLIHVSPVDNIKQLQPAFRSKTKGKFMYPTKRCFFTIGKAINPFKLGTADALWTPSKTKLHKYVTSADVGEAYIDPTYTSFSDKSIFIPTDKPIPVMKFEDKMEKLFAKFKGKKKDESVKESQDISSIFDDSDIGNLDDTMLDVDDQLFDDSFLIEDTEWYDEEIKDIVESVEFDEETIVEASVKEFLQTLKNWKTSNEAHSKNVFKSSTLTDEQYEKVKSYIDTMKNPEVSYKDYKKAFDGFCSFCHIVPTGTIITKYNLKKGKNGDDNSIEVEYSENTKKIKLPDGIKLFHISKIPGISKLIPQFKGKSERGYLYDKPRVYFTINKYMPKFLADYKATDKLYKYECKKDINDVYVDPLVWNVSQGAVYVETDSDIPVKEVKLSDDVKKAADIINPLKKNDNKDKEDKE